MDVREAAAVLGVSERRVRQKIAEGRLDARLRSGRWEIDPRSLHAPRLVARPMAPRIAWAFGLLGDGAQAPWLRADEKYRLRRQLARLSRAPDPVALCVSWLARRAVRTQVWCENPSALLADERLRPAGVCDPRAGISAPGFAEAYVLDDETDDVMLDHGLIPAHGTPPNVILHRAPMRADPVPTLFLVADLAEHGPGREHGQAEVVLTQWATSR